MQRDHDYIIYDEAGAIPDWVWRNLIKHTSRKNKKALGRMILRRLLRGFLIGIALGAVMIVFGALVIRAIDIESQWRADRLCSIYGVCAGGVK